MPKVLVEHFKRTAASYDACYNAHRALYRTELAAQAPRSGTRIRAAVAYRRRKS
jgi:hypothetical protein